MAKAKESLAGITADIKETASEFAEDAGKFASTTGEKFKNAAKEEWAHATEKFDDLKKSFSEKEAEATADAAPSEPTKAETEGEAAA